MSVEQPFHDLDSILKEIGSFGRYQRLNFVFLSLVIAYTAVPLVFIFITRSSNYRCYVPECDGPDLKTATYNVPWMDKVYPCDKQGKPLLCQRYQSIATLQSTCNLSNFDQNALEVCDAFVFETPDATIEYEFNLTCDANLWKLAAVGSMGDLSELIGLPIFGFISDRYGRRNIMISALLLTAILGTWKSLVHSYHYFMILELVETLICSGVFSAAYIMAVELVTQNHRVLVSTLLICSFSLGEAYICIIAYLTQSWRPLLRILYLPGVLFLSFSFFLNESVRWLLATGKEENAKRILRNVAATNGITLHENVLEKLQRSGSGTRKESLWQAFTYGTIARRFAFCAFIWLTCTFLFYGFNMKAVSITGNLYVNYLSSVLIEIPANILCYCMVNNRRRKPVLFTSLLLTGLLSAILLILPLGHFEIVIFTMGKMGITISLSTIYVYVAEMFPTSVRHSLLACCSMFGRIGGMAAPQIPLMTHIAPEFVYFMFTSMALASAGVVLTLPESSKVNMPDTLNQAVTIVNDT